MALFTYSMEQMRSTVERFVRQSTPSYDWATVTGINPLVVRRDSDLASIGITPQSLIDKDSLLVGDRVYTLLQNRRVLLVGQAKGGAGPWVPVTLGSIASLGGDGASQHHVRRVAGGLVEIALDLAVADQGDMIVDLPDWATPSGTSSIRFAAAITGGASGSTHIDIGSTGIARIFGPSGNFPTWAALNATYSKDRP